MFIMIPMQFLVRAVFVFVFLAVAIESAAQSKLRMADNLMASVASLTFENSCCPVLQQRVL